MKFFSADEPGQILIGRCITMPIRIDSALLRWANWLILAVAAVLLQHATGVHILIGINKSKSFLCITEIVLYLYQ